MMVVALALTAFAQGSTSEITGKVTDPNGAVVAGATVTATDANKGVARTSTTDSEGAVHSRITDRPP